MQACCYSPLLHEQLLKKTLSKYQPTVVTLMLDCTDIGDDYHYALSLTQAGAETRFEGAAMPYSKPHFGRVVANRETNSTCLLAPLGCFDV